MIKLFTDLKAFPKSFIPPLVDYNHSFVYVNYVNECDYILLPHWEVLYDYNDDQYKEHNLDPLIRRNIHAAVEELIALASTNNKKLIVVYLSDSDKDISIPNACILRTSLFKSKQQPDVFAYPSWNGDFQVDYMNSKPVLRTKKLVPSVGFRGSAVPLRLTAEKVIRSQINLLNDTLDNIGVSYRLPFAWSKGQILRNKAISRLMSNNNICSDFSVQIRGYISQRNEKKKEENRKLFVKNIIENDYILCVRGAGNYSFRLYETLSAGRIPIIVNTDCVLPYDFIIDWKKYCVWVEEKDIDKIDEILLDYHQRVLKEEFLELQVNIRKLWEEWVSPEGFYKNFDKHLRHTEVKQ